MKTRKKRGKTGKKWARYGLKRVKESGSPGSILRSDPRSTGPGYPLEDPDIRWVQDEVREFEFNGGSYIDISLGQAVIKDISRSCGDECSYPTTIAHFCIAPVVQTCGEGASVAAADCAAARNICLQKGLAPPACRPPGIFETALAQGLMVDYSSAGLVRRALIVGCMSSKSATNLIVWTGLPEDE
eukprot:COSAG04_NODE_341_length_16294_cov_8.682618_4_plen_186_part_00